jgi:hypothetical protein
MRSSALPIALLLIAGGVACGRTEARDSRLSDELQRDLAAAASSALELANAGSSTEPMRVVSAIEQIPTAAPEPRRPKPKPTVARNAAPESEEAKAPDPEPQPVVSTPVLDEPEVQEEAEAIDVAEAPRVPVVAPRPAPVPVDVPSTGGGGSGVVGPGRNDGPDWGDIIGVVIRQGGRDPGHCPPRRRPRPGFPIPYQSPVQLPHPGIHR